jgi:hypothetical protein
MPGLQRIDGLDVVVTVHQQGGLSLGAPPLRKDRRVPAGGKNREPVRAPASELAGEMLRAQGDVGNVLGQIGNGGNADPFHQLAHEPISVSVDVSDRFPHRIPLV